MDSEALAALYGGMLEKTLLENVRRHAVMAGWLVYHTHNSQRSEPGFPDLVLVRGRRVLFRELKKQKEKPTPVQQMWLDTLAVAGQDVGVWRPYDWGLGMIEEELR